MLKTVSQSSKKGFTMIEIMVVIAIIGIITIGLLQMDFNGMNARQKRDRIVNNVTTLIRTEITKNNIGKAIRQPGGTFEYPTKTLVIFDTWAIRAEYYSGASILNQNILVTEPFYGDNKYMLSSGTGTTTGGGIQRFNFSTGASLVLELLNGKDPVLYYSWATKIDYTSAKIRLGYNPEFLNIDIDTKNSLVQIEK